MVASPLTLVMDIKSQDYEQLKAKVEQMQSLPPDQNPIVVALNKIGTVHFARFVFLDTTKLAVITTYDGEFQQYIDAFVDNIGHVFDTLLAHIKDAPALPVATHREDFLEFVQEHDLRCVSPFYSAYPDLKVLDILTLKRQTEQ